MDWDLCHLLTQSSTDFMRFVHMHPVGDALMPFTERSRLWTCYQGKRLQFRIMTRPDIELMKAIIHEKVLMSGNSNSGSV